jgi:dihydrofolate reductase
MGHLVYTMNVSLDGFIETPDHGLDWARVDDELHTWFNEHTYSMAASLYGRRMYEVMNAYWPTSESDPDATEPMREYGRIWRSMPKYIFSTSLERVEGDSQLVAGDVAERLAEIRRAHPGDLEVSGPTLASAFIARGLVDEYFLIVHPVVLGAGTRHLPSLSRPLSLDLRETRRFGSGVVLLRYDARLSPS